MSTSTDAILFYGYCWNEEGAPYDDNIGPILAMDDHLDDVLCAKLGGPERPVWDDNRKAYSDALGVYWPARDAFLIAALGAKVEIVHHCSDGCTLYGLAIKVMRAHRGYSVEVDDLTPPDGAEALAKVADILNIDITGQRLGWWLVSWWS